MLTTLAAVGFAWIFGIDLRDSRVWWIAAIMLMAQFSISALNEWADADLDAQAGRRRPIPLGLLSPISAALIAVISGATAVLLSALSGSGILPLVLLLIGIACGWAYDLGLKRSPLSFLPFAVAFPLMAVWTGVIAGRPLSALGVVFLGGIPLATAIHLADAIPDRDSDRAAGVNTLAVTLGQPGAEVAAVVLLAIGTVTALIGVLRRGGFPSGLLLAGVAASYLVIYLASRDAAKSWAPLVGKWVLIAAAGLAGLMLVLVASDR